MVDLAVVHQTGSFRCWSGGSGDIPGVTHLPTQVVAWQGFSKPPLLYPPVHCPGSRTLLWSVDLHFTVLL